MTRVTPFTHPLLLGFDGLEQLLDRVGRLSNEGYPPFNIEQTSPVEGESGVHHFRITLDVETADLENGLLSIDLVKPEPSQTARRIEIGSSATGDRARDAKEIDAEEIPVPTKTAV